MSTNKTTKSCCKRLPKLLTLSTATILGGHDAIKGKPEQSARSNEFVPKLTHKIPAGMQDTGHFKQTKKESVKSKGRNKHDKRGVHILTSVQWLTTVQSDGVKQTVGISGFLTED